MNPFQFVEQKTHDGCFVAALATVLRSTYDDAYKIVHGDKPKQTHSINPLNVPYYLKKAGINFSVQDPKKAYRRWKRPSLVVITWKDLPSLAHTLIWDPCRKSFIDPSDDSVALRQIKNTFNTFAVYRLEDS